MFRDVAGSLSGGHDRVANFVFAQFSQDVGTIDEHLTDDMSSFVECGVWNIFRGDDGKGFYDERFFVKGSELKVFT